MIHILAWIGVALILTCAVVVLFFFLRKRLNLSVGFSISDILNIVLLFVAFFSLEVAIDSLQVAKRTYDDAVRSGQKQLEILDASRNSLKDALATATAQQELLKQNLAASTQQLAIIKEQWDRELAQQRRHPMLEIGIGALSPEETQRTSFFNLEINDQGWGRVQFLVYNRGNAPTMNTSARVTAQPLTVHIDQPDFRLAERMDHYRFNQTAVNLQPLKISKTPYSFDYDVTPPPNVQEIQLTFTILAENLEAKSITVRLKLIHR